MTRRQGIAVLFCILLIFTMTLGSILYIDRAKPVIVQYQNKPKIIIDSGHGGFDGGAVGIDGTVEKDINLGIALKLEEMLKCNGFDVLMTRREDISLQDPQVTGLTNQKRSDMYYRRDMMKSNPDGLFLSIHQNKFPDANLWGAQIFYSTNHPSSEYLAQLIQQKLINYLQPENRRQIKPAEKNLFLMDQAEIPAVLVECGFLSNLQECEKLRSTEYQEQVAFTLFLSLMDYYQLV